MAKQEKPTLTQKIENFVKFNWWSMSILYAFGVVFMIYSFSQTQSSIETTNALLKKHISSVVLMTPDGRAVDVQRTQIDPDTDSFKQLIKRVVVDHLIIDLSSATKGFEKKVVKNEDDIYNNSEKLNFFAKHYLSHDTASMNMFKSYLTYLLSAINRDELPEYISPYESEIVSYKSYPDGKFQIIVNVKFQTNAFYIEKNSYQEKHGKTTIKAAGDFDLMRATPNNPLGLSFKKVDLQKIEKREDGEKIK